MFLKEKSDIVNTTKDLVELLIKNNLTIATAESCTGGMLASKIIDVSSASKVISESFITYSNEAKIKYLNVEECIINKYGVISKEVAKQMALGCHKQTNADICVGITGLAGPGGYNGIDAGTIYVGVYIDGIVYDILYKFGDIGRNEVRTKACDNIINFIYKKLTEILYKNQTI